MILEQDSELSSSSSENSVSNSDHSKKKLQKKSAANTPIVIPTSTCWTQTDITLYNLIDKLLPEFYEYKDQIDK
jgi:hypothetical protein